MDDPNIENFIFMMDNPEMGPQTHLDRKAHVWQTLTAPKSQGGLGLTGHESRQVIKTAVLRTCRALYEDKTAPRAVASDLFFLLVWEQVLVHTGESTPNGCRVGLTCFLSNSKAGFPLGR